MTAEPPDNRFYRPDARSVGWVMSRIDEAAVGRDLIEQLRDSVPCLRDVDPDLIGGAAVECVLFRGVAMAQQAHDVPPGEPV